MTDLSGFHRPFNVAIIGASGAIGAAFAAQLRQNAHIGALHLFSRSDGSIELTDEASIANAAGQCTQPLDLVLVASGVLHDTHGLAPEKSLRDLSAQKFATAFAINTTGPALVAKHFVPLLRAGHKTCFAALSARVGSISDNAAGGWYAYRASKAALNMVLKNLAIETARKHKQAVILGLQPGTVDSALSAPFQSHVPPQQLFSPAQSAAYMLAVIDRLDASASGGLYDWNGQRFEP